MKKLLFILLSTIVFYSCGTGAYSIYGLTGTCPYNPNGSLHKFECDEPTYIQDTLIYGDPNYYVTLNRINLNNKLFGLWEDKEYLEYGVVYIWCLRPKLEYCIYCNAYRRIHPDINGICPIYYDDIKRKKLNF